ncbi:hypothetical protein [Streptomyces boninensis]|uniref:hypothetical protein n=1 Tax=Streptomyces boninensis TaxID=2039455 RepID=UPI003B21713A
MGLLRLLSRRYVTHPPPDVEPRNVVEVRAALLALNGPDVPWVVRDGAAEGVHFVAEWRLAEPVGRNFFVRHQLTRTLTIRMRLVPQANEVEAIEEHREVSRVGNPPRLAVGSKWGRGPARTVSRQWVIERGSDGRRRLRQSFSYDSNDMKGPVQQTVLDAGWSWRSLLSKNF